MAADSGRRAKYNLAALVGAQEAEAITMRIYVPEVLEGQPWVMPAREQNNLELFAIDGPQKMDWSPIAMDDVVFEDGRASRGPMCLPWYNCHLFVVPDIVQQNLHGVLDPYGEWLKVRADPPLSFFNVTARLAAFDDRESDFATFDNGDILTINRHVFRAEAINSVQLFRLIIPNHEYRVSPIYLQEGVIAHFRWAGARGIGFRLVWDEDDPCPNDTIVRL